MTLSKSSAASWLEKALRSLGKGLTGAAMLAGSAALTAGCLDRPVTPAVPTTNNVFIGQIRQTGVDKIDLLFMIDNSISMADKQRILAEAVPVLVNRLITPICVDGDGVPTNDTSPNCGPNASPEFKAVQDIHIGIITSSIGDHGSADICSPASATVENTYNDLAQLVPTVRPAAALPSWAGSGFLVWDPRTPDAGVVPHDPPGYGSPLPGSPGNADAMVTAFTNQLAAAGEHGCGYEAQLESWYRFLVDPEPVRDLSNADGFSVRGALNQTVLDQRARFLRPDSLLAIIMLTDENDCSILDEAGTQGWLVAYKGGVMASNWRMPRAHQICATSPNDPSCGPCAPMNDGDPACAMGPNLAQVEDAPNVRCYRQKQRFGVDLLYPTSRYVQGLTSPVIDPRFKDEKLPNPIFAAPPGEPGRDPGLVFLAGIVGVPWQDIATDGSIMGQPNSLAPGREIQYMTANEILQAGRWDTILGDPANARDPQDPFMIESIDPRRAGAMHPFLGGVGISPPEAAQLNVVNGHEQAVAADRADLQFACIFDLVPDVDCTMANEAGCDCNADERVKNSPLCTYTSPDPATDGRQERAKAYPGLRELQVLKDMGSNAIVASICPKNVMAEGSPTTDAYYGYNPAVSAIVSRLKEALTAKCLPRALVPEDNPASPDVGKVPCAVVEVRPKAPNTACEPCNNALGRFALEGDEAKVISSVKENMSNLRQCGGGGLTSCDDFCMCKLQQFTGAELTNCVSQANDPLTQYGYCYVDETVPGVNADLLASCDPTQRRILRFMGTNVPAKDGLAFIACIGEAARATPTTMP